MTDNYIANQNPELSPSAEAYRNAEQTFRKTEGKLFRVLNDAQYADDELLDAYKQARYNLSEALKALIEEQNLSEKD